MWKDLVRGDLIEAEEAKSRPCGARVIWAGTAVTQGMTWPENTQKDRSQVPEWNLF